MLPHHRLVLIGGAPVGRPVGRRAGTWYVEAHVGWIGERVERVLERARVVVQLDHAARLSLVAPHCIARPCSCSSRARRAKLMHVQRRAPANVTAEKGKGGPYTRLCPL